MSSFVIYWLIISLIIVSLYFVFVKVIWFVFKNYINNADDSPSEVPNPAFDLEKHGHLLDEIGICVGNVTYLGGGSYGKVYSAFRKSNHSRLALKVINANFSDPDYMQSWLERAKREINCLEQLTHPNIVQYHGHEWLPKSSSEPSFLVIKTQLLNCSLHDFLVHLECPVRVNQSRRLAQQIGSAIDYMHDHRLIHHDIKTCNIMVDGFRGKLCTKTCRAQLAKIDIKIIDFGACKKYDNHCARELVREDKHRQGTEMYFSPEKQAEPSYNPFLADSYAYGVVLIEMLMGVDCFNDRTHWDNKLKTFSPLLRCCFEDYLETLEQKSVEAIFDVARGLVAQENERIYVKEALEMLDY